MKLLKELYKTYSPSGRERGVSRIVRRELNRMGIGYHMENGIIHRLVPNQPLLCAHMDQVNTNGKCTLILEERGVIRGMGSAGSTSLGADDKNGVWLLLSILEQEPELGFMLTVEEEIGGWNTKQFVRQHEQDLDKIPWCVVLDRHGGSDIIGVENGYCMPDMDDAFVSLQMGYKSNRGVFSDANHISWSGLPCINISVGYYLAHTEEEYTVISDLMKARELVLAGVKEFRDYWFDRTLDRTEYCEICGLELLDDEEEVCEHCKHPDSGLYLRWR